MRPKSANSRNNGDDGFRFTYLPGHELTHTCLTPSSASLRVTGRCSGTAARGERQRLTWNSNRYAHSSQCSCAATQLAPAQRRPSGTGQGTWTSTSGSNPKYHTKYCAVLTWIRRRRSRWWCPCVPEGLALAERRCYMHGTHAGFVEQHGIGASPLLFRHPTCILPASHIWITRTLSVASPDVRPVPPRGQQWLLTLLKATKVMVASNQQRGRWW